ncbi:hypothetical protein Q9966_014644 [Columba livia]|nr:hypothetical protein Q9966_014644 [Columba livia]
MLSGGQLCSEGLPLNHQENMPHGEVALSSTAPQNRLTKFSVEHLTPELIRASAVEIELDLEASEMFICLCEQPDKAPKNWEFYEKGIIREGLVS